MQQTVFDSQQPIDIYGALKPGRRLYGFFEDYYNKVYVIPPRIDYGSISAGAERVVTFWNAHFFSTTMLTHDPVRLSGIEIVGPAIPFLFKPLATARYTVVASAEGDAKVDGLFSMHFEHTGTFGQETAVLPVTGSRARISPLKPNWREPFSVNYEFRTEVITSRTGKEQRRSLRASPRKRIEFTCSAHAGALRKINENMALWHSRTILMPERPRAALSDAVLLAGDTELHLASPAPSWAIVGVLVMLVDEDFEEPRTIAAVDGNWISFDGTGGTNFPAGTRMVYVAAGVFPETMASKRLTNNVAEVSVVFDVTPTSEATIPVAPAAMTFHGKEVFLTKPNWKGGADLTYSHPVEEIDFGRGKTARVSTIHFETLIRKFEYIGRDFATADAAREFFYRMRGQRGEFYMPTWENDLVPAIPAPALTNILRIDGYGIFDNYEDDTVHKAICAIPFIGDPILRKIDNVHRVDDNLGQHSAIQIDTPWPIKIDATTIQQICWMPTWRLSSDSFTLEWQTNTVAQFALTMQTVEDLP